MKLLILALSIALSPAVIAQQGWWSAQLHRSDGKSIPFTFEWKKENGKPVWYIHNATEKIRVDNITAAGDSFIIQMPVFESQFRLQYSNRKLSGVWLKGGALKTQAMPFTAEAVNKRFTTTSTPGKNISGKWSVTFANNKPGELSVAELQQNGNTLSGTFLNPTGDYRYLEGIVTKDSLYLSCFDGSHAFLITAVIENSTTISAGTFYSGALYKEAWQGIKDAKAKVTEETVAMYAKPGEEKLHFTFKDLEGKPVSIDDVKFKNKVVIVQLMGSWCPNCMDETAFLSAYYNKNKQRGVEIIALAYEYSTDWERSVKSLQKFQQRFNVQYSILNTGVTVTDSLRTEKTLPELTPIRFFPSAVILDKKGKIRKLDTGFTGPATGAHYVVYKKEFENTITKLLLEN
ncbi:peroxiredoxin family protein [Ferruginibacter sp. SUN106]|uniref:peroxiredoxin family protein n=1 Tax=Ferruginibacter sp. SUN106 TaxID=2978348 RepID=UPI003D35E468